MANHSNMENFEVAMLIDDIAQAKLLSDALREFGIFAHYFQTLEELWVSLNTSTPDLCLVDVKKMSQGTLLLKQHKKIQQHQLKCAFFYSESSKLLLNSTFDITHEGLVCAEINIKGQLQALLNRVIHAKNLNNQRTELAGRVERLKNRGVRLVKDHEANVRKLNGFEKTQNFVNKFGAVNSKTNFIKKLVFEMSEWEECIDFGVYQLNTTNQKLVSPDLKSLKYKAFPDLWLTKPCSEGIANYATEMAYEVCYGLMDENIRSLRIFGQYNNPDILLIGRFNDPNLKDFDWKMLSTKLNSEYRRALSIELSADEYSTHVLSSFESFDLLDDIQFHESDIAYRVASFNLSNVLDTIKTNVNNRFQWKAFYADFASQLESHLTGNFKFSSIGVDTFLIFLDQREANTNYRQLQKIADSFPFWRYFEDHSLLATSKLKGEVKIIAPSALNVLRKQMDTETPVSREEEGFFAKHREVSRRHLEL